MSIKTVLLSFCLTLLVALTACEEGGDYVKFPDLPAVVYVHADVYDVTTGESVISPQLDLGNTGFLEFPQGVTAGTEVVVAGTYEGLQCCDTLHLPELKPGDVAYCHMNVFLCNSIYAMHSVEEKDVLQSDYVMNTTTADYTYQESVWHANPFENILYGRFFPLVFPVNELGEIRYMTASKHEIYSDMIGNIQANRVNYYPFFGYYASGWSLTRFLRLSHDKTMEYALTNLLTKHVVLRFTMKEQNAVLVYHREEVAHPEFADFYHEGEGYTLDAEFNQDGRTPNRAGGGIFYED